MSTLGISGLGKKRKKKKEKRIKTNFQEKNVFFITERVSTACPLVNYNKSLIKMSNMFGIVLLADQPLRSLLPLPQNLSLVFFSLGCYIIAHNSFPRTQI